MSILSVFIRVTLIIFCLLVSFSSQAEPACKRLVVAGDSHYMPFMWQNKIGALVGANIDVLKELNRRTSLDLSVEKTTRWVDAKNDMLSGRVDLLIGMKKTESMQPLGFDYIQPALFQLHESIWINTASTLNYRKWADLKGFHGGSVMTSSNAEFNQYAKSNLDIEQNSSLSKLFKQLSHKKLDYVLADQVTGKLLEKKLKLNNIHALSTPISTQGLYLVMSHNSACNDADLKHRLSEGITNMVNYKITKNILSTYLNFVPQKSSLVDGLDNL